MEKETTIKTGEGELSEIETVKSITYTAAYVFTTIVLHLSWIGLLGYMTYRTTEIFICHK